MICSQNMSFPWWFPVCRKYIHISGSAASVLPLIAWEPGDGKGMEGFAKKYWICPRNLGNPANIPRIFEEERDGEWIYMATSIDMSETLAKSLKSIWNPQVCCAPGPHGGSNRGRWKGWTALQVFFTPPISQSILHTINITRKPRREFNLCFWMQPVLFW